MAGCSSAFLTSVAGIKPEIQEIPCCFPVYQGICHREGFDPDCAIRHLVLEFRDSPQDSIEIRHSRAEYASLAAPETTQIEPHRRNFGGSSLFRILPVPRERTASCSLSRLYRHLPAIECCNFSFRLPQYWKGGLELTITIVHRNSAPYSDSPRE
jgi:hypothetical protein